MFRRRIINKRPDSAPPSKIYPRCELRESRLFLKQFLMLKVNGEIPESISISVMRDWLLRREMNVFEKRYKQLLKKLEKKVIQELQEEHQLQIKIKDAISPIFNSPVQSPLTTILSSGSSFPSSSPNKERSCYTIDGITPRLDSTEFHKNKEPKGGTKDVQQTPIAVITKTLSVVAKYTPSSAVKITSPPVVLKNLEKKETSPPVSTGASESVFRETLLEDPGPVATITLQSVVIETLSPVVPVCVAAKTTEQPSLPAHAEGQTDTPPPQTTAPDSTKQGTLVSVSNKKKCKMRLNDLSRKETGDVLDAFKESPPMPTATPLGTSAQIDPVAPPPVKAEEMRVEKEDKPNAENVPCTAPATPTEQNDQYKGKQWKLLNPEGKKIYDREFLLGLQFISASKCKPEGLPCIKGVVLDKVHTHVNKTLLCPLDRTNCGPDFTPLFVDLDRQLVGGQGQVGSLSGPDQSGSCEGSRKSVLYGMFVNSDIHLHKTENPWQRGGRAESDDATQELLRSMQATLNKMTPQMFQTLLKQMEEMTIDTEEKLKGVVNLVFEKAISEPNFSFIYAKMCHCLNRLKVSTCDTPGVTVNFRKLLVNLCQKEFNTDRYNDEIFKKKEMELDAATEEEVRNRLIEKLDEAKDAARRRNFGNIKFIGELFKAKLLTENIIHDCVVKLLKNHNEESLEYLCILLSTVGKDLDFEKARPHMDLYFNLMKQIIKDRQTSCRICFKLQDLIDLRQNKWMPRRADQGPKTINQIHKDAEIEQQREQMRVQQRLRSVKDVARVKAGSKRCMSWDPR